MAVVPSVEATAVLGATGGKKPKSVVLPNIGEVLSEMKQLGEGLVDRIELL